MDKKKQIDSSHYAYATGRIRALETRLIGSARLGRYLEARSADDIGRLLLENGYPAAPDPEQSLNRELEATYLLVRSLSPDPVMIDTIMMARDFHNLKVMLKAFSVYWPRRESSPEKAARTIEQIYEGGGHPSADNMPEGEEGQDSSALWPAIHGPVGYDQLLPLLQQPSTFDPLKLFNALREQKPGDMPPILADTAAKAAARYQQTYDISEIDILVDKTFAQQTKEAAEALDIPFFTDYVRLRADLVNVGLLMRTRFLSSGAEYLQRILLPGGMIATQVLVNLYGEPVSTVVESLTRTNLAPLADAVSHFSEGGDAIARFSLAADDLLVQYVQKAKRILRGPEVLLGYLIAREMEIKTIRVILTCLRNRIPVEKARELSRLTYL